MAHHEPPASNSNDRRTRSYRAITRHTDGRIILVQEIQAASDAEAIGIVTARGSDIRTDLWSDHGLVRSFPNAPKR